VNGDCTFEIPADQAAFAGHFPGSPVLPGALLLDEILRRLPLRAGAPTAPLQLASAKFRRPVLPGTRLQLEYTTTESGRLRFAVRDATGVVADGVALQPTQAQGA
jgi:3-hydroxyacyl-[acyl-carrier-protein] dehydratase